MVARKGEKIEPFTDGGFFDMSNYEKYKKTMVYKPVNSRVLIFLTFCGAICWSLHLFTLFLDRTVLPGARYLTPAVFLGIVLHIIKLMVTCQYYLWQSSRRGITLVERSLQPVKSEVMQGRDFTCIEPFKMHRADEVEKVKKSVKFKWRGPLPVIVSCSGNGGGGHEATLEGIKTLLREAGLPVDIHEIPMAYLIEFQKHNPLWNIFGVTGEQLYNWGLLNSNIVAWMMTNFTSWAQFFALNLDRVCGKLGDLVGIDYGDETGKLMHRVWAYYQPDLVLDFTQGAGESMYSGFRRAGLVHTPVIKVVSDFEGLGIHKWIEDTHQYIICGTSRCREQALNFGIPPRQVFQTSGMILRPDFYECAGGVTEGRESVLESLGLDPTVRTALVCWGGVGGNIVLDLGTAILASKTRVNIIFMCGRNEKLQAALEAKTWGDFKVLILGFTPKVPFYMQISDFCVCKPGPGVCSEATVLGLPMIVQWSTWTLPQEVPVSRWVIDRGLGLGFSRISHITGAVELMCRLLGSDMSKLYGPKVIPGQGLTGLDMAPQHNRAVFEIPSIIEQVLSTHDYTPYSERKEGHGKEK